MSYTTTIESVESASHVQVQYLDNGSQVTTTSSLTGTVPKTFVQRLGNNDLRNVQLLHFLKKVKPKRVRFIVRKVVVGFRYVNKRIYFIRYVKKRITKKIFFDVYIPKVIVTRSGLTVVKQVRRTKYRKEVRYLSVPKLQYRVVRVRVPIKIRVRVPIILPGVDVTALQQPELGYLLPNPLTFVSKDIRLLPQIVSSQSNMHISGATKVLDWSVGIGRFIHHVNGFNFDFTVAPSIVDDPIPAFDDIYLESTALWGLYKKVTNNLPSSFTSLAELPETIKAVLHVFKDGIKLYKNLKHLDSRGIYDALNKLSVARKDSLSGLASKTWLQWYLAISPTLDDVAEHISLLSREERVWRSYGKSAILENQYIDDQSSYGLKSVTTIKNFVKFGVIVTGRVTIDEYRRRAADSGTLTSALYAVVPFSFIADWAVDLSTYLESATVFEGLSYTPWKSTFSYEDVSSQSSGLWGQSEEFGTPHLLPYDKPYRLHVNKVRFDRSPIDRLPEMPLIPWTRNIVSQTEINRSLTALSLARVLSSKKN